MKLITENIEEINVLTEESNGKKNLYIEGIFLQSEVQNRNGRIYPFAILEREVEKYQSKIKEGRALGELGHPENPGVNLHLASHKIVELRADGTNFYGKAKIMESTPQGKIAAALLSEGVKLGVSSRGVGTLEEKNGVKYVCDDFMLSTAADIVADPSAPDAFVNGIMEGVEWVWDNGMLKEHQIANMKKYISEADRAEREERQLKAFNAFMSKLSS